MFYWGEIWIKHQNTFILTILVSKCDRLQPYPGHESQKNYYFFTFAEVLFEKYNNVVYLHMKMITIVILIICNGPTNKKTWVFAHFSLFLCYLEPHLDPWMTLKAYFLYKFCSNSIIILWTFIKFIKIQVLIDSKVHTIQKSWKLAHFLKFGPIFSHLYPLKWTNYQFFSWCYIFQ